MGEPAVCVKSTPPGFRCDLSYELLSYSNEDGVLFALDPETGGEKMAWDTNTDQPYAISGVNSGLYALDSRTGAAGLVGEIGFAMTSAGLEYDPVGDVRFAMINSALYALHPETAEPTLVSEPERGELPNLGGRLSLDPSGGDCPRYSCAEKR